MTFILGSPCYMIDWRFQTQERLPLKSTHDPNCYGNQFCNLLCLNVIKTSTSLFHRDAIIAVRHSKKYIAFI